MSRLRDPAYVSKAKHRWGVHIMRGTNDRCTLRTLMNPSWSKTPLGEAMRWADVFVARTDQLNSQLVTSKDLDLANVVVAV
ncbi:unnamed protein product [Strongylus vulgaris]|uniref:Uncharacterized protein n=1 Tax=Strongylus vulgaris TaxID=40348 RepID=A0A3P7ISL3_STRVU|nr:unnamed protein product [Strongylus vulgaris]